MWSEPIKLTEQEKLSLAYPLIATPIGSGIRFMTNNCGAPMDILGDNIANDFVRQELKDYGVDGLDGTIQIAGSNSSYDVRAALNEKSGYPDFEYFIQDVAGTGLKYRERCDLTHTVPPARPDWVKLAMPVTVYDAEGTEAYWRQAGLDGFVGITLKTPGCYYMDGRTPFIFMEHLEYTKWIGGLATAVGFTGTGNRLDYITCVDPYSKRKFNIEGGFTPKQRLDIWRDRQVYNTFIVRYWYQPLGTSVPLNARFKKISKR